jgi:hypothetical protein
MSLVASGDVKKLAGGYYYRPRKNRFGEAPPEDRDIVRAFLKTTDFLLGSFNHYNQLGLSLSQVYNTYLVYDHKRSGDFFLGESTSSSAWFHAYPEKLARNIYS